MCHTCSGKSLSYQRESDENHVCIRDQEEINKKKALKKKNKAKYFARRIRRKLTKQAERMGLQVDLQTIKEASKSMMKRLRSGQIIETPTSY